MKTKLYITSLLLLFSTHSFFAQTTLTSDRMPLAGDTIHYRNIVSFSGDMDLTGENFFWDMSDFIGNQWVADTFVAVSSTPLVYNVAFNNPVYPKYKASCASKQANIKIPLTAFEFSNIYNYYKLTEGLDFSQVGMAITVNNVPIPIRFDNIDNMYNFPFEFGDFDSCYSSYGISIPSFGHYSRKQTRLNYFDGYGTLITPVDTFFDVIRIKTLIQARDSVHIDQYSIPIAFNTNTTEYKWFAPGYRGPVAQITKISGQGPTLNSFKYRDTHSNYTNIKESEILVGKISPNPFHDQLSLTFSYPVVFDLQLYALNGHVLWQSRISQTDVYEFPQDVLNGLSKGVYFVRLSNDSKTEIHQIVKH